MHNHNNSSEKKTYCPHDILPGVLQKESLGLYLNHPIMHTCMLLIKPQKLLEWPQKLKKGTNSKRGAKNNKMAPKAIGTLFGECLNYKSGLRILIWPLEVPFFWVTFAQKCPFSDQKTGPQIFQNLSCG